MDQAWQREQNGSPHEVASGDQAAAENIVVVRVNVGRGGGVDVRGNPTATIQVVGEGEATVFRNGTAFAAAWRKRSGDSQFEWLRLDGSPLPLAPGRTWVELLPSGGLLEVQAEPPAE